MGDLLLHTIIYNKRLMTEVNWRNLHFGEDIPTEKIRLARTTFLDTFEVERLISKKIVKNEVTFFSIV